MVPTSYYLIVSAILFSLGVFGVLLRKNTLTIFMSIELMLNAVNLSFRSVLPASLATSMARSLSSS